MRLLSRSYLVIALLLGVNASLTPNVRAQSKCLPPAVSPNPANLFSEEQEMALGDAVASHIESSFRVIDDVEVTGNLRRIGNKLIAHMPPTKLRFRFFVVDINDMNAFTLPGGRVYVTRKMIAFAKNEDELAGVIAHELGHVFARHLANDMSVMLRETLGTTHLGDSADVLEQYHRYLDTRMLKPKAGDKLTSREDRDQYAADLIGLYLMSAAGYDPQAQAGFWDRYHETKGKTGGFFSSLFGTTRPEQKRLGEMFKQLAQLPAECKAPAHTPNLTEFQQWQTAVVRYSGVGRKEALTGLVSKTKLEPRLRSTVYHVRFSPDAKYLLAQDDAGISVLTRQPFAPLFRINSQDAYAAQFTPDSTQIVFYTSNLRVETWSVAEHALVTANEIVLRDSCIQTRLSPDGKNLACLNSDGAISLFDVEQGTQYFEKKSFTTPSFFEFYARVSSLFSSRDRIPEEGNFVNMAFSPDGRYLAAGDHSFTIGAFSIGESDKALVFDVKDRKPLTINGDLKRVLIGGFAFVGSDRIFGRYYDDPRKSGLYKFPEGTSIERMDTPSASLKPVTKGSYALMTGSGQLNGAVINLETRRIFRVGEQPFLDVYDGMAAAETANGELAIYGFKGEEPERLMIPENPLGRLYAATISPDLKFLAISGKARGAIWSLDKGNMITYVRGFHGAGFGDDGLLYMDFPANEQGGRTVGMFDPVKKILSRGPWITSNSAVQYGSVLVRSRPPSEMREGREYMNWAKGLTTLEVFDAKTMAVVWSQEFTQEFPGYIPDGRFATVILGWPANSKTAAAEYKSDPAVTKQLQNAKESEDDYFFKVVDLRNGKTLGQLLVETNRKSFRLTDAVAAGDYFVASDSQDRTQVYSISTGRLLGRVFGKGLTLHPEAQLLCVENESGQLIFYNLRNMEKHGELSFGEKVRMVRFSNDGKTMCVVTVSQNVYVFDVTKITGA